MTFSFRFPEGTLIHTYTHSHTETLFALVFKMDLEEQKFRQKVLGRSLKQWILLYALRIVLNLVVLLLMSGSIYLIYFATNEKEVRGEIYDIDH